MTTDDARGRFDAALDQVQDQLGGLAPDDLGRPTPCADFDAGTLAAHVVAVLRRLTAVGRGGGMFDEPDPAPDVTDRWAPVWSVARAAFEQVWAPADMARRTFVLPWASMTGEELFDAYAAEFTVHSWDLAQLTRRDLDDALAEAALRWYRRHVPDEGRGTQRPFAPAVAVPADAGAYQRLAGYVGRPV